MLNRIHHCAHIDAFVERITQTQGFHPRAQFLVEAFCDTFLHQKARPGAADLTLIEPDRIHQPLDGAVQIGVVKHDVGALAAQLQSERLAGACRRFADLAPHGSRSGKGDFVHVRIDDHLAHGTIAGNDIHDALGQARLTADVGKQQRSERRIFSRFQDHRVAHRQRGRDLPCQHQEREVPRDDLTADAKRLPTRHFLIHQLRVACVMVEMTLHQRNIDVAALADRLAVVECFEHRKEAAVLLQKARNGIEICRPARATHRGPITLRGAGSFDSCVYVFLCCLRQLCQHLAGCGIFALEGLARRGEATIDKVTELASLIDQPSEGLCGAFGGGAIVHGVKNLFDCHLLVLTPSGGGSQRSKRRSHGVRAGVRYRPAGWMRQSGRGPVAASGCPVPLSSG